MPKKKLPGLARTRPDHLRLVGSRSPQDEHDSEPPPPAPGAPVVRLVRAQEPSRALLNDCDERRAA